MKVPLEERIAEKAHTKAKHAGMGAIHNPQGVTFREWTLYAESVCLIPNFNGGNETSTPSSMRKTDAGQLTCQRQK